VKPETADDDTASGTGITAQVDPVQERFTIPRQSDAHLHRQRLREQLEAGAAGPLTLVSAPAGTGKTVVVSDWARRAREQGPVAWVTLEAADASRPRFWSSFAQGLGRCGVAVPPPDAQTGPAADGVYLDAVVSALVDRGEDQRAQPVVVVLDCEADISAPVAEDLDSLLHRSAGLLHLVLAVREDPVLPLHRYRLAGTVVEIRLDDLAFSPPEAREVMRKAGVELSEPALTTIVDRTRGWGAGLRFAAVTLARQDDPDRAALDFCGST